MDKNFNFLNKGGKWLVIGSIVGTLIAACGGGGSSTPAAGSGGTPTPAATGTVISGVAASGAPVSKGIGYALDATTGTQIAFVTGTDGKYSVDLVGKTGPFLIHVRGITNGGSPVDIFSLASTANFGKTINVTPLSDVVVGYAAGKTTTQLETACTANLAGCPALFNGIVANLALSSSNIVKAMPASVLAAFTVPSTFDAISTPFTPNHTGVDGLLDALQVVPPVAGGTSYAINLNGSTPIPLITVPVTAAATGTSPTTNPTAPTAAAVTQAANLAVALADVQTLVGTFNQAMTAAAPGYPTATTISALLDPAFMLYGMNGTQFSTLISSGQGIAAGSQLIAGAQAPYASASWAAGATAPAVSIAYDANNCVTKLWTYFGANTQVTGMMSFNKTVTNPTGCVGTWKIAGNGTAHRLELTPIYQKFTGTTATSYFSGFQFDSAAKDTLANPAYVPYSSITVTGPGLTTKANFAAKGTGVAITVPVVLTPPAGYTAAMANQSIQNVITGWGSSVLNDCTTLAAAAATTTPCYDSTAAVKGSDYVAVFKDAGGVVLETNQHRLNNSLGINTVPTSWFGTITSITPSKANLIPLTQTTMTVNYTVPAGAYADWGGVFFYDVNGAQIWWFEQPVTSQTSNTFSVPGFTNGVANPSLPSAPASGTVTLIAPIGGLKLVASQGF